MSNIDEKPLIGLVRNYPLLYDVSSPLYNDQPKKEEAWNEIASLMSVSVNDCKTKWTRVRENYRKAMIVRKKNIGRLKDRVVKHEKDLSFLNENITFKTKDLVVSAPNITSSTETNKSPKEKAAANKPHEMDVFFQSIAETMKRFPKKMQVQLKRQIFNVVNDAESAMLDNENGTSETNNSPMEYKATEVTEEQNMPSHSNSMQNINYKTPEQYCIVKEEPVFGEVEIKEENI